MNTQQTPEPTGKKQPYVAPRLMVYGQVKDLTQAGSFTGSEGSSFGGSTFRASDRRLKEHIVQVGSHPLGLGLYLFSYKQEFKHRCGQGRQFGVMADEVEHVMPAAVSLDADGFRRVDYAMLGIEFTLH
jgi:hypothetical protein